MEEPDALRVDQRDKPTDFERRIDAAILLAAYNKSQLAELQQKVQDATKAVEDNMRELHALREQCSGKPLQEVTTEAETCTSDQSTNSSEDGRVKKKPCNSPPAEDSVVNSPIHDISSYVTQPSETADTSSRSMEYQGEKDEQFVLEKSNQPHDKPIRRVQYRRKTLPQKSQSLTSVLAAKGEAKGKKLDKKGSEELQVKLISHYGLSSNTKQFIYPYQLAIGPNNGLFVSDRESHQIIIFNDKLDYMNVFGSKGPGRNKRGTFYNPTGLAVDVKDSFLFVADHNNMIQKFKITSNDRSSCKLEYISHYGEKGREKGQLHCPCGLAFCSKGLFVCDFRNHRIQVFKGSEIFMFGRHGTDHAEFNEPHSIAINSNEDKVFVTDHSNDRVQVFTPEGDFIRIIVDNTYSPSHPQLRYPRGIFYTPDGHLLVSCTHTHCIVEFTEDGDYVCTIESIIQPGGVVLQHTGEMVVTSNVKQVLYVITSQP